MLKEKIYYISHGFLTSKHYPIFMFILMLSISFAMNMHQLALLENHAIIEKQLIAPNIPFGVEKNVPVFVKNDLIEIPEWQYKIIGSCYFLTSVFLCIILQNIHPSVDIAPVMDLSTHLAEALAPVTSAVDATQEPLLIDNFEINAQNRLVIDGQFISEGTYYLNSNEVLSIFQDMQSQYRSTISELRLSHEIDTNLERYQTHIKSLNDLIRSLDNFIMSMVNMGKLTQADVEHYNAAVANMNARNLTRR